MANKALSSVLLYQREQIRDTQLAGTGLSGIELRAGRGSGKRSGSAWIDHRRPH